jgi:hypothetical protein
VYGFIGQLSIILKLGFLKLKKNNHYKLLHRFKA